MSKVLFLFFAVQFFSYAQEYDFPGEIEGEFIFFKSHDNKIHLLTNNFDYVFNNMHDFHYFLYSPNLKYKSDANLRFKKTNNCIANMEKET